MTQPEKLRIAKRVIGTLVAVMKPTEEQVQQIAFGVSRILNVEEPDVADSAKLDHIINDMAAVKVTLANIFVALAQMGAPMSMPTEVANAMGLQKKEKSPIVLVGG